MTAGAVAGLLTAIVAATALLPRTPTASRPRFVALKQIAFDPVPVIVVVFDEFPLASLMTSAGEIDAFLYPSFARLAEEATWYRNATTVGVFTKDALPAILTGVNPDGAPFTNPHPRNLFTLLGDAYPIHMRDALPGFCAPPLCRRESATPALGPEFHSFATGERGSHYGAFLDLLGRASPDEAGLYFLHTAMPHSPWRYLPTGQRYLEDEPEPGEIDVPGPGRRWSRNPWLTTQVWQRHLLQVGLVDRLLGELVDVLESRGLYDRSLLIVTADHGIAFEPGHPKRLPTSKTIGHVGPVPLFVKRPDQRSGATSDVPASVIDIVPTIAEALHLSRSWPDLDGRSLISDPLVSERSASDRARRLEGHLLDPAGTEKYEAIRAKEAWFGRSPFDVGPGNTERLLGRRVRDLGRWHVESTKVDVFHERLLETTDPRSNLFPALVEGRLPGETKRHRIVAIAVDGRVVAVTRTYGPSGATRFYAMVSPSVFDPEPNLVRAFVITRG